MLPSFILAARKLRRETRRCPDYSESFDSFAPGSFETRSLPSSLATTHRGFTFYVAFPKSSIRPLGLPIYVARLPSLHSRAAAVQDASRRLFDFRENAFHLFPRKARIVWS